MSRLNKSTIIYVLGLNLVSVLMLITLNGIMKSDSAIELADKLIIDGEDFSIFISFISLFIEGINSISFAISVISGFIFSVICSFLIMRIIHKITKKSMNLEILNQTKKSTFIIGAFGIIIGLLITSFKMIDVILIIYLPVPIVSWISFCIGFKPTKLK